MCNKLSLTIRILNCEYNRANMYQFFNSIIHYPCREKRVRVLPARLILDIEYSPHDKIIKAVLNNLYSDVVEVSFTPNLDYLTGMLELFSKNPLDEYFEMTLN